MASTLDLLFLIHPGSRAHLYQALGEDLPAVELARSLVVPLIATDQRLANTDEAVELVV